MSDLVAVAQLASYENEADTYLEAIRVSWLAFTSVLLEIKRTGAWQQSGYSSYNAYIRERWLDKLPFGESRIRQFEAAYDTATFIRDITGKVLNENVIRTLKTIVPDDDRHLLPELVTIAYTADSRPSKRLFQATYEALKENPTTATLEGIAYRLDLKVAQAQESALEIHKRYNEHVATNSKYEIVERYEFNRVADVLNRVAHFQLADDEIVTVQIKRPKQDATPVTNETEGD